MAARYLSGDELLQHIKFIKHKPELPQRGGFKEFQPDGSWLQNKRLEQFHDERRSLLLEERVQKISSLATGEWDDEHDKVLVIKSGKFWKNMGHVEDGKQWLYPEEALFLIDEGVMEVYRGGVPLSVEEAYSVCLRSEIPLEHYQAFAHLCRLGYIVRRFENTVTKYENLIGLDERQSGDRKNSKKRKLHMTITADVNNKRSRDEAVDSYRCLDDPCDSDAEAVEDHVMTVECARKERQLDEEYDDSAGNIPHEVFNGTSDSDAAFQSRLLNHENLETLKTVFKNSESRCDLPLENNKLLSASSVEVEAATCPVWDFDLIKFPDISKETSSEMVLKPPPSHLLPPGVEISKPFYTIDIRRYRRDSTINRTSVSKVVAASLPARNWTEYKRILASKSELERLVSSPAGILWTGDVTPLVRPSHATSTEAVLSRMKVTENVDPICATEMLNTNCDDDKCRLQIVYSVYLPDSKFRKSNPGTPVVCLCVNRQGDRAPSFANLCRNLKECPKGSTLMWAVVDNGDVAFYSFNGVDLPRDDSFP